MLKLSDWWSNFVNTSRSDITPQRLATIEPYIEYNIYWAMKCAQVSSLIGGLIVHPIYRIYLLRRLTPENTTNNSKKIIRNICRRIQGRFLITGLAISPLVTFASVMINDYSTEDVMDRCYEIRRSGDALTFDRYTAAAGFLGWYWKRFQGGVDGFNLGIALALYYFYVIRPYFNELVKPYTPEGVYSNLDEAAEKSSELMKYVRRKINNSQPDLNR